MYDINQDENFISCFILLSFYMFHSTNQRDSVGKQRQCKSCTVLKVSQYALLGPKNKKRKNVKNDKWEVFIEVDDMISSTYYKDIPVPN